jgi:hypothetical protein
MNAAAPEGTPPRRIGNYNIPRELIAPPCLGEALRRVILTNFNIVFWINIAQPKSSCSSDRFLLLYSPEG